MSSTIPHKPLSGSQKRYLRALAHHLSPCVQVGMKGISDEVIAAIVDAFKTHELIKVRMRNPDDKKGAAKEVARASQAYLCGIAGHCVILYRRHPDSPRIHLPKNAVAVVPQKASKKRSSRDRSQG